MSFSCFVVTLLPQFSCNFWDGVRNWELVKGKGGIITLGERKTQAKLASIPLY
jgi:hypothetical protein